MHEKTPHEKPRGRPMTTPQGLPEDLEAAWGAMAKTTGLRGALVRVESCLYDGESVLAMAGGRADTASGLLVATSERLLFVTRDAKTSVVDGFAYDELGDVQFDMEGDLGKLSLTGAGRTLVLSRVDPDDAEVLLDEVDAANAPASTPAPAPTRPPSRQPVPDPPLQLTTPMPVMTPSAPWGQQPGGQLVPAQRVGTKAGKPWIVRHKVLSAIVALIVIGGIASAASGGSKTSPTTTGTTSGTSLVPETTSSATPSAAPAKGAKTVKLVSYVGQNLDDAKTAAGTAGLTNVTDHDVSGQGRHPLLDLDWRVCSQTPAVGKSVPAGSSFDLGVVKTGETCPGAGGVPAATAATGGGGSDASGMGDAVITKCFTDDSGFADSDVVITNHDSQTDNYIVTVAFESKDGKTQVGTGNAAVDNLEQGQASAAQEANSLATATAGFTCKVADVTRYPSG